MCVCVLQRTCNYCHVSIGGSACRDVHSYVWINQKHEFRSFCEVRGEEGVRSLTNVSPFVWRNVECWQ